MSVPRAAYGSLKNDLTFALRCAGDRGIETRDLVQAIYGEDTKETRNRLHLAMNELRRRMAIETRTIYVLKGGQP